MGWAWLGLGVGSLRPPLKRESHNTSSDPCNLVQTELNAVRVGWWWPPRLETHCPVQQHNCGANTHTTINLSLSPQRGVGGGGGGHTKGPICTRDRLPTKRDVSNCKPGKPNATSATVSQASNCKPSKPPCNAAVKNARSTHRAKKVSGPG